MKMNGVPSDIPSKKRFETINAFRAMGKFGNKVRIDREIDDDGNTVCFCSQYRGGGMYFSTLAEVYAYCVGRGWISAVQDPYHYSCTEFKTKKPY